MKSGEREMNERLVTYEELSEAIGISVSALRTYLGNFRFDKYVKYKQINGYSRKCFIFNENFIKDMSEFLWTRRRVKEIRILQNYYKKVRLEND